MFQIWPSKYNFDIHLVPEETKAQKVKRVERVEWQSGGPEVWAQMQCVGRPQAASPAGQEQWNSSSVPQAWEPYFVKSISQGPKDPMR